MTRNSLENYRKQNIMLFRPAIALMNRLRYPQKFFLISLLFVLPLALVLNFLLLELDSRSEFTQKELYGNAYLRSLTRLRQYIPRRQLILQRQSYQTFANQASANPETIPSQELLDLQNKIDQEFTQLTTIENKFGKMIETGDRFHELQNTWKDLRNGQQSLEFRNYDSLMERLDRFHSHVVDGSNLILDPDLDTYYLMDATALKIPEIQKILHRLLQIQAEAIFKREITTDKRASLISAISLLSNYSQDLSSNLERAFKNTPDKTLRSNLEVSVHNFVGQITKFDTYIKQLLILQDQNLTTAGNFYQQEMESTLVNSFDLWEQLVDALDSRLNARLQTVVDRKRFILIFVAIIFITITYLFIGFYLSVMRTVHQLDIASKQMTTNGAMSIKLDSQDELAMVVESFNNIAIALKESEEKYRSIFENSVDGIFQTTVDGKYLNVNPALAKIYGYASVAQMLTEIVDIQSQLYVDRDRRQHFQNLMEENDTITNFESEIYKRDRRTIWISENVRAIRDEQGKLLYYEGTVEDITLRKVAEIALEEANQKILALNDQLKQENLRMSSELEVTRKLQQMILPKDQELLEIVGLDIAGFMEPAAEVGGDYYDVLQQNGRIKIGIGDVTGHGLESGMLMIMVQTAVRTLLQNEENDPVRFLDTLNRTIYGNVQRMASDKNLTLALIDYEHGKLTLSGQHEELIVVRKNGVLERFDTIDLGFPIGLEEEISEFLSQKQINLESGDVMVLYTDGITEAENEARKLYGVERLCEVIRQNVDASATNIRQAVIKDLRSHIGTQKIYDDITLLVLKQK